MWFPDNVVGRFVCVKVVFLVGGVSRRRLMFQESTKKSNLIVDDCVKCAEEVWILEGGNIPVLYTGILLYSGPPLKFPKQDFHQATGSYFSHENKLMSPLVGSISFNRNRTRN